MGYQVERPAPGEEAEDPSVAISRLVAAEWPDEPRPVAATREAFLGDLVAGQERSPDEMRRLGRSVAELRVDVAEAGAVQPRIEQLAWYWAKVALAGAWRRVQALWGGQVPPSPSPEPSVAPPCPGSPAAYALPRPGSLRRVLGALGLPAPPPQPAPPSASQVPDLAPSPDFAQQLRPQPDLPKPEPPKPKPPEAPKLKRRF